MHDLTGFQRDLLVVIAGNDGSTGLALKEELNPYYEEEIHNGRLYQNLDAVVEKGLVQKEKLDGRKNNYSLAERGKRQIEARREWEDGLVEL